jgi:hypothetical protein
MGVIQRAIEAHKHGRLLSGASRNIRAATVDNIRAATIDREPIQRFRLALPKVSGRDFPAIVTSGDFSNCEGRALKVALEAAIDGRSKLPAAIGAIRGMSGLKYRILINTLIEMLDRPRYLEIGSWLGSTAAAAIYGNNVQAVCIDNWSEFSGTKEQFLATIEKTKSNGSEFHLIERDFREVDYRALGKFNVYLFDGPHSEVDHMDGILVVQPCLADRFVLIVDDWNWRRVRSGTMRGLLAVKYQVESSIQVRTTNDDVHPSLACEASDWHNGYFIAVVRKGEVIKHGPH